MLPRIQFLITIFYCFYFLSNYASSQDSSICLSQTTCDRCLEASKSCAWCTDRAYDMKSPRCMEKSELEKYNCREKFIEENRKLSQNLLRNENLSDFSKTNSNAHQLRPQWVKLNLRKNEVQVVKMKFRPAKNYPLDLYYLMDLTWSMKDDKETLVRIGGGLAKALNNLTENTRLGFGSYADKPALPYIMISDYELNNPCSVENAICKPTYLYKHQLSLTTDVHEFVSQVNASKVTGNIDAPEGGLEALMQVLVCEDQIGWKEKSRKIVVLATDAQMHMAGDGLLGGAIAKNNKMCYLDQNGDYTAALTQDYPSLEEIYRELSKRKVNVIFAVTEDVFNYYQQINELMTELTRVGVLQSDSSNILQLVEEGFKEFSRKINFKDDAPDYLKIDYFTTCGGKFKKPMPTASCDNVEIGKEYDFELHVHLLESPDVIGTEKLQVKVEETSLDEYMVLDFELELTCPCLKEEIGEKDSPICSNNGELKCGMCFCNEGFIGKTCDCSLKNYASTREMESQCRLPEDGSVCSNRGECLCGNCYCSKGWEGKYCECEACAKENDMICNNHGTCNCGKCSCHEGWEGENCECSKSLTNCISPDSAQVCSNHGKCICGQACDCDKGFYGTFCEIQAGQNSSLCSYYEGCVQAKVLQRLGERVPNYMQECSKEGFENTHEFVGYLEEPEIKCITRLKWRDDICDYEFTYNLQFTEDHKFAKLLIQDQACPPPNYAMIGFWATLITTLIVGFLGLLIWRVITIIKDRRDYARFEEALEERQFQELNPIYKHAHRHYNNPTYISRSKENVISAK